MLSFVSTDISNAQGLLGKHYIEFQIGQLNPGDDVENIDDSIFFLSGKYNNPFNSNVDTFVKFEYSRLEGEISSSDYKESTSIDAMAGINYQFRPKEEVNPFLNVSVGMEWTKVEINNQDSDETDSAFSVGGGVEVELNQRTSLVPELVYIKVNGDADVRVGTSINYGVHEGVFGSFGIRYEFEQENILYSLGLGFI
jgi:predicted porin